MGLPKWVDDLHTQQRPYFAALEQYIVSVLGPFCERHGYQFTHRVKSPSSTAEKLESGRFHSWWELDDFVAATVIVPNLTHENRVLRQLGSVFTESKVEGRQRSERDPRRFQFDSTRWYGLASKEPPPEELPPEALGITFEVQVQTVLEYAWSIATHDTTYKGAAADWSQMRLASTAKAIVEQLDLMIANFVETAATIPPAPHAGVDGRFKVIGIFHELLEEKAIEPALEPDSWVRFADNVWQLVCHGRALSDAEAAGEVVGFISALADELRKGSFPQGMTTAPTSGSLFQLVLAWASSSRPELLDNFPVIPSSELEEIYGLPTPTVIIMGDEDRFS